MRFFIKNQGFVFALIAAVLFGASTPAAKVLLQGITPWLTAGLLYLGSGCGLFLLSMIFRCFGKELFQDARLSVRDIPWISGAIFFGGICAPVFLMMGLLRTDAASASLLLNLEGVFTACLAWFVFKENFDRRIAVGMALILMGGAALSWKGEAHYSSLWDSLLIIIACLCWALDNNFTRKISGNHPVQLVTIKSLIAGGTNVLLALLMGASLPNAGKLFATALVGLLGYGASLLCFIFALRHIGTSRTGAYFSIAPFIGSLLAVLFLQEPLTPSLGIAAVFMAAGVWLHLTESHEHHHVHEGLRHAHTHRHDEHHQHSHVAEDGFRIEQKVHSHIHDHKDLEHSHEHFPDIHHSHRHKNK